MKEGSLRRIRAIAVVIALMGLSVYLFFMGLERAAQVSGIIQMFAALITLAIPVIVGVRLARHWSPDRSDLATGMHQEISGGAANGPHINVDTVSDSLSSKGTSAGKTGTLTGASLAPPTGSQPAQLHGRDRLLRQLCDDVCHPPGRVQVLTGLGGVGKSTIALELCRWVQSHRKSAAWWIYASDRDNLVEGLVSLAHVLGGNYGDREAIQSGSGAAWDRLWQLLQQAQPGWLLVFDNADDPNVLAPLDGTGWLRCSDRGLVLVTSRLRSAEDWGSQAALHEVVMLHEDDAAHLLMDLAPNAGNQTDARTLANRLACLPLALHIAGRNIGSSKFREWNSFAGYKQALDDVGVDRLLSEYGATDASGDSRSAVMRTWELSLESLDKHGLAKARLLLRLLSCYAAPTPIPVSLLAERPIDDLIGAGHLVDDTTRRQWVQQHLDGLDKLSLIGEDQQPTAGSGGPAVVINPLVAETNRAHLDRIEQPRSSASDPFSVRRTAVRLVGAWIEPLEFDNDRDWPMFRALVPHISALFDFTGSHLDSASLAQLVTIAAKAVAASAWGGAESSAETLAKTALKQGERLDQDDPANLALRNELAWAVGKRGRWLDAEPLLREVLAAREKRLGVDHRDTLDSRHKHAWAVGKLGDWPDAEARLRAVLAARTRLLGADDPATLHTRCCLLWAMSQTGRLDEAITGYEELHAVRAHILGRDHTETWDTLASLAEALVLGGRYTDAEQLLRRIIAERPQVLGYPETLDNRPRYWLGCALHGRRRYYAARKEFKRLYADQVQMLGPDHPATLATGRQLNDTARNFSQTMRDPAAISET